MLMERRELKKSRRGEVEGESKESTREGEGRGEDGFASLIPLENRLVKLLAQRSRFTSAGWWTAYFPRVAQAAELPKATA